MDAVMRGLAREAAVDEAEQEMRGIRRLTVYHGLRPQDSGLVEELVEFVDDVCHHHDISTLKGTSLRSASWLGSSHITWRFQPLNALSDLRGTRWPRGTHPGRSRPTTTEDPHGSHRTSVRLRGILA